MSEYSFRPTATQAPAMLLSGGQSSREPPGSVTTMGRRAVRRQICHIQSRATVRSRLVLPIGWFASSSVIQAPQLA